jgi:hypothetical protein
MADDTVRKLRLVEAPDGEGTTAADVTVTVVGPGAAAAAADTIAQATRLVSVLGALKDNLPDYGLSKDELAYCLLHYATSNDLLDLMVEIAGSRHPLSRIKIKLVASAIVPNGEMPEA